ncbi:C1 family peptidase [Treponema primitia]|uniref:C1 family peptidase n=1 Tax=Treponema primitia TaxID=88058 RepID=UPI00397FF390
MKKPIVLALLLAPALLFAQTFPTGAILDAARYNSLPQKAVQVSRAYTAIPGVVSLKSYAPLPGHQGKYGTCVGWSSAYAARTILESLALSRTDRRRTTDEVFSPVFLYKSASGDPSGERGMVISYALDFMQKQGVVKQLDREQSLDFMELSLAMYSGSRRHPIAGYTALYRSYAGTSGDTVADRVKMVRKSLAERKPVIIGMNCPPSFFKAKEAWQPAESPDQSYGGHAMCVVGYDDTLYGGAFEVQNSWGETWGNGGYIWIPYEVFGRFAYEAYEIIENLSSYQTAEYAGAVTIELRGNAQGMPVRFRDGCYRTVSSYPSGTQFRYLLGNTKPAYVYAFAADEATVNTTQIFPPEGSNISPVLDYGENLVAFPEEFSWIQMDNTAGSDYLVVLYAKQELDLAAIRRRFAGTKGNFPDRVAQAVGPDFIPPQQANYEIAAMKFSASSTNLKAVFGLLLAIDHRP